MRSLFAKYQDAWLRGDSVTPEVPALFNCVGRELVDLRFNAVVDQTQTWMTEVRPVGTERWAMAPLEAEDMETFECCADKLGLLRAIEPARGEYTMGVVLGATYSAMERRLKKLRADIECGLVSIQELIIVTGVRPINEDEKRVFASAGIEPIAATEADAARLLLSRTSLPDIPYVGVASAPNRKDGKRATTEETIFQLAQRVNGGSKLLFASHMPFLRQMLTVERALDPTSWRYGVDFTFAPPAKPTDQLVNVIIDEACRLLYELSKRPAPTPV